MTISFKSFQIPPFIAAIKLVKHARMDDFSSTREEVVFSLVDYAIGTLSQTLCLEDLCVLLSKHSLKMKLGHSPVVGKWYMSIIWLMVNSYTIPNKKCNC